jgi:hypothetical protein
MTALNQEDILSEVVVGLRNADIFTTTQRNVTTAAQTGSIAGTTITINRSNVKNVRSITIGSTSLSFGSEYTVNYDSSNTCVVTFAGTQTGSYSVSHDYGSDKIFSGYPRNDISIDSFPRIAVEFIDISSEIGGVGNVNQNRYDISIVCYDPKKEEVRRYITAIRQWIIDNQNSLYYSKVIKPTLIGPIVIGDFEKFKDRIFQQNIDYRSIMNLEIK